MEVKQYTKVLVWDQIKCPPIHWAGLWGEESLIFNSLFTGLGYGGRGFNI